MSSNALSLDNISKSFGTQKVLEDINLEAAKGEFIVFVGPSGCGKSTLLRIIAGLETADTGTIGIEGDTVNSTPPAQREIAFVFQSYALYPHLDVRNNMSLGLKQTKTPASEIRSRIKTASTMLSLEDYLERYPAELSGGQRQRVAIGRAIVREPKLFLFDEPLSNLDAGLRVKTRLEIAELHRKLGTTMIYVTHDQTEAMTLADRIVVLNEGKIEQIGSPLELYNRPANRFIASFISSPQMNFIEAKLTGNTQAKTAGIRPEHITLDAGSGTLPGKVLHLEQLGSETNVHIQCEAIPLMTVRMAGQHDFAIGTELFLSFDENNIHYFDENDVAISS